MKTFFRGFVLGCGLILISCGTETERNILPAPLHPNHGNQETVICTNRNCQVYSGIVNIEICINTWLPENNDSFESFSTECFTVME